LRPADTTTRLDQERTCNGPATSLQRQGNKPATHLQRVAAVAGDAPETQLIPRADTPDTPAKTMGYQEKTLMNQR
jgi:hypothetical protein